MNITTKTTLGEQFSCSTTHLPSGSIVTTESPKEKGGKGSSFSPPELLGATLSSCMLNMLHYAASSRGVNVVGATAEAAVKEENLTVVSIDVSITVPNSASIPEDVRTILEKTTNRCPVHKALEAGTKITTKWTWA